MPYRPLIAQSAAFAAWFWSVFAAWGCMETWAWLRERGATAGQNRDRGSRLWIVVSFWIGMYAAFALMYAVPAGAFGHDVLPAFAAGIALLLAGMALRGWAILTLGRFFRTSVIIQGEHRLVTHGPYRYLRNPSYSGALVSMLGLGLAMNNWFSLATLVAFTFVAYSRRIAVEQRALTDHFGQPYRDYIARTWALIPFVW